MDRNYRGVPMRDEAILLGKVVGKDVSRNAMSMIKIIDI